MPHDTTPDENERTAVTLFAGGLTAVSAGNGGRSRARRLGWILLIVALVGTVIFAMLPSPYVIERPGPVFDTLGTVKIGDGTVPMIEIPGQKTWPATGSLDMLTVSMLGDPSNLPNWLDVASAWLDPSQAVLPVDAVYPPGYSVQDSVKQGTVDMKNSQEDAMAAALRELGHKVPSVVTVAGLSEKSPSKGILKDGDTIVSVAGTPIDSVNGLRDAIAAGGVGTPLPMTILRGTATLSETVTPTLSSERSRPRSSVYTPR